jgi:hypothetical protein
MAALTIGAAGGEIRLIGATASLVGALRRVAKMLDICPPSAGPSV